MVNRAEVERISAILATVGEAVVVLDDEDLRHRCHYRRLHGIDGLARGERLVKVW